MVLLAVSMVLFVSVAVPSIGENPPAELVATASAVATPVPGVTVTRPPKVLHPNPVPLVHMTALVEVEHDVIDNAVGAAVEPVPFPITVLAACVA